MKHQRGYAVPLCLAVAAVTLFLGMSVAQLSSGDLKVASHEYYQERARQMADYGLDSGVVRTLPLSRTFTLQSLSGAHPDDQVVLTIYDNTQGQLDLTPDPTCPVTVPRGFQYWVAQGQARQGTQLLAQLKVGALVQFGLPVGSAGAQIRNLLIDPAEGNVDYSASNGDATEILCSTQATQAEAPPAGFTKHLMLNRVGDFQGKVQIPQGQSGPALIDIVGSSPPLDQNGGVVNIPRYAPPNMANQVASFPAPPSATTVLAPGHYGTVTLPSSAGLVLNGKYHFDLLKLEADGGEVGRLEVHSGAAELFVDHLESNNLHLRLLNTQPTASAFRLNLKPTTSALAVSLEVHSPATSGGVCVVAPGYTLNIFDVATRAIRGAFCCDTLKLSFHQAGPSQPDAKFVYDITASGRTQTNTSSTTSHTPRTSTPDSLNSGDNSNSGGSTESSASQGPRAMILSKQTL